MNSIPLPQWKHTCTLSVYIFIYICFVYQHNPLWMLFMNSFRCMPVRLSYLNTCVTSAWKGQCQKNYRSVKWEKPSKLPYRSYGSVSGKITRCCVCDCGSSKTVCGQAWRSSGQMTLTLHSSVQALCWAVSPCFAQINFFGQGLINQDLKKCCDA